MSRKAYWQWTFIWCTPFCLVSARSWNWETAHMGAGEIDRGSSSGGRQEYLDNVSVLVTGVYPKCPAWVNGCRFCATVLQHPSDYKLLCCTFTCSYGQWSLVGYHWGFDKTLSGQRLALYCTVYIYTPVSLSSPSLTKKSSQWTCSLAKMSTHFFPTWQLQHVYLYNTMDVDFVVFLCGCMWMFLLYSL